jgi:hypothetical protein
MTRYLAGVLTVIALGTMLIAYGLLGPRAAAAGDAGGAQTFDTLRVPTANDRLTVLDNGFRSSSAQATPIAQRAVLTTPAPVVREARAGYDDIRPSAPVRSARVERAPTRDWKKTAMIVGGSSIAGAGLGAIIGGRKGAAIGAVLAGGAATVYEVRKK